MYTVNWEQVRTSRLNKRQIIHLQCTEIWQHKNAVLVQFVYYSITRLYNMIPEDCSLRSSHVSSAFGNKKRSAQVARVGSGR